MCVIIIKQKQGQMLSREVAKNSARINPHGLGIVWLDTFEVEYHKSKHYQVLLTERPFIAHFRYATVGKICKENTHPFVCGNNKDELFMMNGTVHGYGNKEMTDTEDLAIKLGNIARNKWKEVLAKFDARFVAINTRNRSFQIFNRHLFHHKDGIWYSKTNVLQDRVVAVYGTLKRGYGNYYSYLTNSKFMGSGVTKDKYPLVVDGLPYLIEKKGSGTNVKVDVFKVNEMTFGHLDALESHPRWYVRKEVPVVVKGKTITAWVYFNPSAEGKWDGRNHVESYERNSNYPFEVEPEVEEIYEPDCSQIEMFDEAEFPTNESPICIDCYHDLEHDGFANFHCNGCGQWFTEDEVLRFS